VQYSAKEKYRQELKCVKLQFGAEILNGLLQPILDRNLWLPPKIVRARVISGLRTRGSSTGSGMNAMPA